MPPACKPTSLAAQTPRDGTAGAMAHRWWVWEACAQAGQPEPCARARMLTTALQGAWLATLEHCHQALRLLRDRTFSGCSSPLRSECHSAASSGWVTSRLLHLHGRLPAQTGQPVLLKLRACTWVVQVWGWPHGQAVQSQATRLAEA